MTFPRIAFPAPQRLALLVATAIALASSGCAFFGEGIDIELSQEQLQRIVDAMFPLDNANEASNVFVVLSQATVTLDDGGQIFLDGVSIDQLDIDQLPQRFNEPVLRVSSAAITVSRVIVDQQQGREL